MKPSPTTPEERTIEAAGRAVAVDAEGFLRNAADWDREVAAALAHGEGIALSDAHWEIIDLLRAYYDEYRIVPATRILVKTVARRLGAEKGSSAYLYTLFPYGPAKQSCKIAGLPRPTSCI